MYGGEVLSLSNVHKVLPSDNLSSSDVMYRVPPLNNTSFDLSFVLPPDLRTITLCSTLSENPEEEDHIECSFEVVVRVGVDIDARAENE